MSRIKRYFEEDLAYFITTVTKERRPIFQNAKLSRILLVTIEYYKTIFDYRIYGYCLMPDHLHAILQPTGNYSLSMIMKMIKGSFARKVNRLNDKEGSLWQKRYFDEAIRSEKQLFQQLDYMHENPVKAGLVSDPKEYPYSSFSQYHGPTESENHILKIDPLD